jgi:lipopolysaccharide/colanic/teichoic acid biosynthesis glycosyltransferase/NDP-sugar pyrophosphorylase family protein
MTQLITQPASARINCDRRPMLREHRAVVVIERRKPEPATVGSPVGSSLPTPPSLLESVSKPQPADLLGLTSSSTPFGWQTILGNAPLARLFEQLLADADTDWAATVVPEEDAPKLSRSLLNDPCNDSSMALVSYNGQLKLSADDVQADAGQAVYLLINGHQFPLCDLRHAINAHRFSRADVTVFDVQQQRPSRVYDEKLRVDVHGHVARVDRFYDATPSSGFDANTNWPAVMALSPAAMRRLIDTPLPHRLDQWPNMMLRAGLRLAGASLPGRAFDLHDADQVRELSDDLLRRHPDWICRSGALTASEDYPKVWMGDHVTIGRNVELIGPVVLGDNVHVGDNAVIVGPAAVGTSSRIGAGAVLRRRILPPESLLHARPDASIDGNQLPRRTRERPRERERIRLLSVLEAGSAPKLGGMRHGTYLAIKRAMDIAGAILFLFATLLWWPLIALAIKINSPGPVFYGHLRQGRGGKNFKCWKFRTMIPNAEQIKDQFKDRNEVDGPQFKITNDPRIFAVGKWLRKLNIDEWPQFWNVLKGEMSLVGPRPSPERENQMCPAWREARLSVRPGVTGLWQVCRQREQETDFQEWIYYDVQYVKKQSIRLDLKILLKTFKVALKGS